MVNELKVEGTAQVTLQVRIVEMSRSVTRSLGIDWPALGNLGTIGKLPALNAALNGGTAVACTAGPLLSAACLGLNLSAAINALASDGLVHVLAEPNLTVTSGEPASFLVGGEFPIPVGQQNGQVTIEFKSYGVQLAFVPTVLERGRINLKVRPEVSQLTQQGAVNLTAGNSTISVPALTVRRAETTVELGSGQSFAIAGLLQDASTRTAVGLPGLRQIPILGQLFRSDSYQRNETELVILVTPILSRPVDDPATLHVPTAEAPPGDPPSSVVALTALHRQLPEGVPRNAGFMSNETGVACASATSRGSPGRKGEDRHGRYTIARVRSGDRWACGSLLRRKLPLLAAIIALAGCQAPYSKISCRPIRAGPRKA